MVRRIKTSKKGRMSKITTRALQPGARLKCADNSGAKQVEVISVIGHKTRRRRRSEATIGDMIVGTVKQGTPEMRKKVVRAIVVRIRKPHQRISGIVVRYEDNACVVVDKDGNPKGSEIKGAISKEAVQRWPALGKISKVVL